MSDRESTTVVVKHACIRCGAQRIESEMTRVGAGWACHVGSGTTCAMQLIYRGYGHE